MAEELYEPHEFCPYKAELIQIRTLIEDTLRPLQPREQLEFMDCIEDLLVDYDIRLRDAVEEV